MLYTGALLHAEHACVAAAGVCKGVVASAFAVVYTGAVATSACVVRAGIAMSTRPAAIAAVRPSRYTITKPSNRANASRKQTFERLG
eukprot:6623342-Pyramimonas_sp.AAC.1